jgi:hypothetical protein
MTDYLAKGEVVETSLKNLNAIENIPELETMKQSVLDSIQKSLISALTTSIQTGEFDVPVVDGDVTTGEYVNASQAAKMYGCSQGTMTQWFKNGIVSGYVNAKNGRNMILKTDVEKLINTRTEENAKKAGVVVGVN